MHQKHSDTDPRSNAKIQQSGSCLNQSKKYSHYVTLSCLLNIILKMFWRSLHQFPSLVPIVLYAIYVSALLRSSFRENVLGSR